MQTGRPGWRRDRRHCDQLKLFHIYRLIAESIRCVHTRLKVMGIHSQCIYACVCVRVCFYVFLCVCLCMYVCVCVCMFCVLCITELSTWDTTHSRESFEKRMQKSSIVGHKNTESVVLVMN